MEDRMKKGLLAIIVIAALGLAGREELNEERMHQELIDCVNRTDGSDAECDSCYQIIYGDSDLLWKELIYGGRRK